MKDRILTFIIGLLVGAIITTGIFLIINKTSSPKGFNGMNGRPNQSQMGEFQPGDRQKQKVNNSSDSTNQNTTMTNTDEKSTKQNSNNTSNVKKQEPPQGNNNNGQQPEIPNQQSSES